MEGLVTARRRTPRSRPAVLRGKRAGAGSVLCAALLLLMLVPATASAAPRALAVDGFYGEDGRGSDYVTLQVRTRGARTMFLNWPGRGGACAKSARRNSRCRASRRSSIATVEFKFHNCRTYRRGECTRPIRRFRVRVDACRRGRCRSRIFRGTFREQS